jgi:beta-glucosidase
MDPFADRIRIHAWLLLPLTTSNAGVRLGGAEVRDSDELLQEAVDLAKDADCVIAIIGLNTDWEAEAYDRTTLALPGRTDELIERVAAVNPKTVVVTQAVRNTNV